MPPLQKGEDELIARTGFDILRFLERFFWAFMILATPIFYPVIVRLGYDLIWFGIFLQIVVMIGIIIPPMAVSIFVVQNITQVPIWEIYSGVFPFLLSFAFCAFLLILFPQIVLFLPSLFAQ